MNKYYEQFLLSPDIDEQIEGLLVPWRRCLFLKNYMGYLCVIQLYIQFHLYYSQISISRSCGDHFYKFEWPEVQINLHFR